MKGTHDQLERNLTARQTCDNSAFASLTDEEKQIIAALRDPKKAPQLYELMQLAEQEAAEAEKHYGTLALSLGLE